MIVAGLQGAIGAVVTLTAYYLWGWVAAVVVLAVGVVILRARLGWRRRVGKSSG
jgi:hypothetical protein